MSALTSPPSFHPGPAGFGWTSSSWSCPDSAGGIAHDLWRHNGASIRAVLELPRGLCEFLTYIYCMGGALSIWWLILGTVFLLAPRLPAAIFPPLISRPGRSLGAWLFAPAVVLFAMRVSATARTVPVAAWVAE